MTDEDKIICKLKYGTTKISKLITIDKAQDFMDEYNLTVDEVLSMFEQQRKEEVEQGIK